MLNFQQYRSETRNIHLPHVEDLILEGRDGAESAISILEHLVSAINGWNTDDVRIKTKYDGSPSLLCGTCPETGKFFVATKSLFNITPKINYTVDDIQRNHSGNLINVLSQCLEYLRPLGIKGVIQGDLLFDPSLKSMEVYHDCLYYVFQPNTLVYGVPSNSLMGLGVRKASIGITFHTAYQGRTIKGLRTLPLFELPETTAVMNQHRDPNVWVLDNTFHDFTSLKAFSFSEMNKMGDVCFDARVLMDKLDTLFHERVVWSEPLQRFFHHLARIGCYVSQTPQSFNELCDYLDVNFPKKTKYVLDHRAEFVALLNLNRCLVFVKNHILQRLDAVKVVQSFIRDDVGALKETNPEGYVVYDVHNGRTVKLVNRTEFSHANMLRK
jgi:hypothetical protein